MLKTIRYHHYWFGFQEPLDNACLDRLIQIFNEKEISQQETVLGGRTKCKKTVLPDIGAVVVKTYHRGGMIRYVSKDRYIKWGESRSQQEFNMLNKVRQLGIFTPKPVCFVNTCGIFYKAWLVTEEIDGAQSMVELSQQDQLLALKYMGKIIENINLLIQHQIVHVDLHPGNILIDKNGQVYLIDFDKALIANQPKHILKQRYIERWQRANEKYCLNMEPLKL
ncbi:MAG: phosphotransferase [Desulfobacterales bacterium]|nr:phosphotransferase [Desulfobacterales bacterium]